MWGIGYIPLHLKEAAYGRNPGYQIIESSN
jgi:hypothetical protein